jgi:hypothetical protein
MAMETFFMENHRNAKAAVFQEKLLYGVGQFGHCPGVLAFPGVAWTSHLA